MAETAYVPRLREQFDKEIRGKLTEQFGYANIMQVPRLDKVVLNMGVGEAVNDRKKAELAAADLSLIAGQKAIVTYSRVAIGFWPAINARSAAASSAFLRSLTASPTPILSTTFSRRGTCMTLA